MDISGISTSLNAQGMLTSAPARGELQPLGQDREAVEAPREQIFGARGRRGLALGILQQELRVALKAHFHARFMTSVPSYADARNPENPDGVAKEALGAAKQLVAESPLTAAKSLISFRARVQETATYVRQTIGGDDDASEIDDVVTKLDNGLDELEGEVTNYRESTASVLAVDTESKRRSTIQVRTQEGDVVKFSLMRDDNMSASDVGYGDDIMLINPNNDAYGDDIMLINQTNVAISSRSRMMMSVEGDLNDSELAAIQNVFAKAEMIANEFYGGDISAAFNVAERFEFDTEQLARVNMRFRIREVSNIAYAESTRVAAAPMPESPRVAPPRTPAAGEPEPPVVTAAEPRLAPIPDTLPVTEKAVAEPQIAGQPVPAEAPIGLSVLEDFLDSLSVFLRSLGEGFAADSSDAVFTYHYSESFKLEMLKAVLHTIAPAEEVHAADNAASLIDRINETAVESA